MFFIPEWHRGSVPSFVMNKWGIKFVDINQLKWVISKIEAKYIGAGKSWWQQLLMNEVEYRKIYDRR
jgi:hypothetical protein